MTMKQNLTFTPQDDYETVRAAIAYLSETGAEDVDLARFSRSLGLTERQLTDLFRRWCGLSPKSFAQAVALNHAKRLLADKESVLSTTYAVGLSSTSRLHDLFVTYEAMPPGAFRQRGEGLDMVWGAAPSPLPSTVSPGSGLPTARSRSRPRSRICAIAGRMPASRATTQRSRRSRNASSSPRAGMLTNR